MTTHDWDSEEMMRGARAPLIVFADRSRQSVRRDEQISQEPTRSLLLPLLTVESKDDLVLRHLQARHKNFGIVS
jgi:hypothetical protein